MMKRPDITRLTILMAAAAVAGLLFLWGFFRGGTADVLFPEEINQSEEIRGERNRSFESQGNDMAILRYDSSRYVRNHPMTDPFFMTEPVQFSHKSAPDRYVPPLGSSSGSDLMPISFEKNHKQESKPVLLGIISKGSDRRILLKENGETSYLSRNNTWKEWYVENIEEQSAVLSGNGETIRLFIEENS